MLANISHLILALLIGIGFGRNLILFAKKPIKPSGVKSHRIIYPYILIIYVISGIAVPVNGEFLNDLQVHFSVQKICQVSLALLGVHNFRIDLLQLCKDEYFK
ncbi:MAG: hypothetical protein Q8S18_13705 [Bacteroidales bacterium]|nr:hypothetical protein [Bacteroidales bacterium]